MTVRELDAKDFDAFITGKNVLIDFYASWCGACKSLEKIFSTFGDDAPEDLQIGKVNIESFPDLAARFGVMTVPHLVYFRDGVKRDEAAGVFSRGKLTAMLKK